MANGLILHNENDLWSSKILIVKVVNSLGTTRRNGLWPSSILNVKLFEGSLHEGHALHSESGL